MQGLHAHVTFMQHHQQKEKSRLTNNDYKSFSLSNNLESTLMNQPGHQRWLTLKYIDIFLEQ